MMRINNKGLSLIELVVSLGVMSILMALATTLILSASRFFEKQAAHTELQNEAQLITNYLTTTIMEATDMNFTITDATTGAGVFEFYEKDATTGVATGKGSQRVLHYCPDLKMLYMVSFESGTAPAIVYGDETARMYLISDEITNFKISFEYGEETDPNAVIATDPESMLAGTLDATKNYIVKNPLRVTIAFRMEHNGVTSNFEISADCRNTLDDITYIKGGATTTFKAYER